MMTGYWFALGACLLLLVFLVVLMRTRGSGRSTR